MSTEQQNAFCVLHFEKYESVITVQSDFRRKFNIEPSTYCATLVENHAEQYNMMTVDRLALLQAEHTKRLLLLHRHFDRITVVKSKKYV